MHRSDQNAKVVVMCCHLPSSHGDTVVVHVSKLFYCYNCHYLSTCNIPFLSSRVVMDGRELYSEFAGDLVVSETGADFLILRPRNRQFRGSFRLVLVWAGTETVLERNFHSPWPGTQPLV